MTGKTINLPTPNLGLNYIDSISTMDSRFCLECVNFFPTPTTLQLRSGFDLYDNFETNKYIVGTLITYNETNGDTIIFAVVKDGNNYYIVDKSERTTGTARISNFPVESHYIKYIVNNNLFNSSNQTKVDTIVNTNLVLGVYTSGVSNLPIYLQNNTWGKYHVIPTILNSENQTTFNPTKITLNAVPTISNNTVSFILNIDANNPNVYKFIATGQIYIIVNNTSPQTYIRVISTSISKTSTITVTCTPIIDTLPTTFATGTYLIMERYLMFDTSKFVPDKFVPISVTQVAGYTAFVFKDNFLLYLVPSTSYDSFSARYPTSSEDLSYKAPLIISFGYNLKYGGNVVDIDSWTVDSGEGQKDYLAIFISTGEIVIFDMSFNSPTISSTFKTGDIFAPNCTVKIKGDLVFLSNQGLDSMNNLVGSTRVDTKPSISYNISYKLSQDINQYKDNKGWDIVYYQPTNMLIINIPTSQETAFQYVMNTTIGAWTKFTNINALCFGQTSDRLLFGNDQIYILFYDKNNNKITYDVDIKGKDVHQTYKDSIWDETNWDESVWAFEGEFGYRSTIGGLDGAYFKQAFTNLGISNRKKINLVKPNIFNYSLVYNFELGVGSDYVESNYTPYDASLINPRVGFLTPPVYVTDKPDFVLECRYDKGFTFGADQIAISNAWFNLPAFGFAFSYQFKVFAFLNDFEYTSTDLVYENSRNII